MKQKWGEFSSKSHFPAMKPSVAQVLLGGIALYPAYMLQAILFCLLENHKISRKLHSKKYREKP
ncbi:hypothetical protein EPI10_000789 [Gossypium australe]|uniref:Uncharacterized protein n=1 Tax=Gossypium australe TaxID=47621 RepID=A0A5B6V9B9_9ROSI|nr:hypothetical protein EPI10_000789 [Gossypium australe]